MLLWLIRPARYLTQLLSPHDSPRQLAWGVAMGILVGLVPKGNLTAVLLAAAMFACRVNLGTGMLAAFSFSWFGLLLDPLAHRIGLLVLTCRPLEPLFAWLFQLPLVPWMALNNTVVVGSLGVGTVQLYFSYRVSLRFFERYQPVLHRKLSKWRRRRGRSRPSPTVSARRAA